MMRGKSSSSLQKTYDECYLTCSTAVYFESQGNEAEALRSWRSALDNIYYHNAKTPTNFQPKSETEKALRDSLRDMEIQCKERVDLLEALRLSRAEAASADKDGSSSNASSSAVAGASKLLKPSPRASSETDTSTSVPGQIGDGTIPAISYSDLSRPDLRSSSSSYSSRPFAPSRNSSERAVVGRNPSASSMSTGNHMEAALKAARNPGIGLDSLPPPMLPPRTTTSTSTSSSRKKSSRSPSPHKERTMLTTLRFGRGDKRPAKPPTRNSGNGSSRPEESVGGKAATLAWNALKKKQGNEGSGVMPLEVAASSAALDASRKTSLPFSERNSPEYQTSYDGQSYRLVSGPVPHKSRSSSDVPGRVDPSKQRPSSYPFPGQDDLRRASGIENAGQNFPGRSLLSGSAVYDEPGGSSSTMDTGQGRFTPSSDPETGVGGNKLRRKPVAPPPPPGHFEPTTYPTYMREYPDTISRKVAVERQSVLPLRNNSPAKPQRRERERVSYSKHGVAANSSSPRKNSFDERDANGRRAARGAAHTLRDGGNGDDEQSSTSYDERNPTPVRRVKKRVLRQKQDEDPILAGIDDTNKSESDNEEKDEEKDEWAKKVKYMMKHLPRGCDEQAAKQIFNDIVVKGDEVHWDDVAGLEPAKNALKEAVVYPFLRPDLFMGLREPARGMLLFGPPGTGKTMLARAVATESKSTFFGVSASSLTSKYLGESEKLVKALFMIAKVMAPSIIFVDEIDSLLGSRGGGGEHEATRRIKTEFLIQWSDLQRAAAGREQSDKDKERGDASRVLVLAATNMPWAIDDAARRRFVRRQYIPLPERETRKTQLATLLGHQKHSLSEEEFEKLVDMTDGFSGSDITALAKDAAMGPLRSLGEALLHMTMDEIRPIGLEDFEKSMENIRPSVSQKGLEEYEEWAREFGERGG